MHDILPFLLVIGVVLAVVTLVGHGIWVLLAAMFSAGRNRAAGDGYRCPSCQRLTSRSSSCCDWCGARTNALLGTELADLQAVERQLQRFRESGAMDSAAVDKLLVRVRDYRQRLSTQRPIETGPTAAPVAATIVAEAIERPPSAEEHQVAVVELAPLCQSVAPPRAPEPTLPPVAATPRPTVVPPSKSFADIFTGFIEERNIRWAEFVCVLISGLLIVGGSVALVVSFWDTLQATYLKFLVFVGYSSAVFGVGLFTYHRWKLRSTGRGLLTIATLLVPLNFVAMASLSPESWSWPTAATELVSLAIFAGLSWLAANVLVPGRRLSLVLAVVGNSALVLIAARLLGPHWSDGVLLAANCAPAVLLAAATVGPRVLRVTHQPLEAADAAQRFTLLGMAGFAAAVALGIIITKGAAGVELHARLHCLAPAMVLAAWPLLTSGLRMTRGLVRDESLEGYRTAGIAVALLGVVLQLAALVLIWPQPLGLVFVGLLNATGLIVVALRHRFPVAHAGAMACMALAYVAGFALLSDAGLRELQYGSLIVHDAGLNEMMLRAILTARTATSLSGLFLLFAAIAAWLALRGHRRHAKIYGVGGGVTAAVALSAISLRAATGVYADALHAAVSFAFYGVASVLVSTRSSRKVFSYVGWNLLAAAPFWTLQSPLFDTWQSTAALAGCCFWLAAVWLLLAWLHRSKDLFAAHQCVLTAATVVTATSWLQTRSWVTRLPDDLVGVRSLQTYGIALGLLSLAWIAARLASRRNPATQRLIDPAEQTVDWFVRHLLVWSQIALAVTYIVPGVIQEMGRPVGAHKAIELAHALGGPTAWTLLGTLAVVWVAALWDRWRREELVGAMLLGVTTPCLVASRFADQVAVGSALRWGLAVCFVACSVFIWQRHRLPQWCRAAKMRVELDDYAPAIARSVLLVLTAWPVVLLTLVAALLQLISVPPGGPVADSLFDRLGSNVSYLVPLTLVIVGLLGYAAREKSAGYGFAAGLVAEMATALGYALSIVLANQPFGHHELITLVQLTTITAATWAFAWLAIRQWLYRHANADGYFVLQIALPAAVNVVLLAVPVVRLLYTPAYLPAWAAASAGVWGWIALLLTAAVAAWYLWQTTPAKLPHVLGSALLGVGVLVACSTTVLTSPAAHTWLEFHILAAAWAVAALIMLGIAFLGQRSADMPPSLSVGWVTSLAALAVVLALIYSPIDRAGVWWSLRVLGAMSVAAAVVALWRRLPSHVFISGLLLNAAGVVAWLAWGDRHDPQELLHLMAICLAAGSATWTALDLIVPQGAPHLSQSWRYAHLAAALGLLIVAGSAAAGVTWTLLATPHVTATRLAFIALGAVSAAIALTAWDRMAWLMLCGLYIAGFAALAMLWDRLAPVPRELCWRMSTELTGYLLVTAVLGWVLVNTKRFWRRLRVPMDDGRWSSDWFMGLQAMLAAAAALVAAWVSIDFAFDGIGRDSALLGLSGRMAGMAGALMLLGGTILMAWQSEKGTDPICRSGPEAATFPWRFHWQCAALAAGLLLNASTGWAALDATAGPAGQAPWLHRSVSLLVAAAMMILVSSFGLRRMLPKSGDWIATGRRAAPYFASLTFAVLIAVLCQEAYLFDAVNGTPMATSAIAIVSGTLAFLIVMCVAVAVSPQFDLLKLRTSAEIGWHAQRHEGRGEDPRITPFAGAQSVPPFPFPLTERSRQAFVYAAEVLAVLLGLHLRMTLPWLFELKIIERYWMFLIMGVAFLGAGVSEFFERRRLPVLSEPLERTALLLPLLPAIGFWFADSPTSVLGIMGRTPMLWILMSAFYGSMAYMRRSAGCAALAVVTANVGLWVALHVSHIVFLQHPQLWLIPIAMAVLVAEYLNHDRLSSAQSTALRYLALSTIYLASTADMFIAGLGKDWRLPLVLMVLSVAGVFAGLLLRVRSFLLLGIVFVLLDIMAMIWHAAVDLEQTWLWYVCLIALGAAIIAFFALFEKRRNDMLAAVEKLKQWQR